MVVGSLIYQEAGCLAATAYVTLSTSGGPQGNFVCEPGSVEMGDVVVAAWTYVVVLGGGEIVVGSGDFGDMDGQIDSQGSYVQVRGMGYPSYIHTSGLNHVFSISFHDYVSLKNLRIAQTSTGNDNDGVYISHGADYFRIESCWITDADRNAIRIEGTNTTYIWIINNLLDSDSAAISTNMDNDPGLYYLMIKGNIFTTGSDAVGLWRTVRCVVNENIFITPWDGVAGDFIEWVCSNNVIIRNNGDYAIYVSWGNRSTITGNIVYYPQAGDGIFLNASAYITISNNLIYDPSDDGIEFDDSDYCLCLGNTIYSSGDDGIYHAAGTASPVFICVGNTVISSAGMGVYVANVNYALLASNMVYDPTENGVQAVANASVVGNYVYSAGWDGVEVTGANGLVAGNYIYDPASDGIYLEDADQWYVSGNYIYSAGAYGIILDADSDSNVFSRNWTRGSATACARVNNADCDTNRFYFNNFDEGNISDIGTNTTAFDNYDPSANAWIAMIGAGAIAGAR